MVSKWLKIGQVKLAGGKNGKEQYEVMELDNENLKAFLDLLKKFGKEKIGDMTTDQIRTAQKLKYNDPNALPRIKLSRFNKTAKDYEKGCPSFIVADLLVDIEQF